MGIRETTVKSGVKKHTLSVYKRSYNLSKSTVDNLRPPSGVRGTVGFYSGT